MLVQLVALGAAALLVGAASPVAAQTEWTLHRTPDGVHPTAEEQEMLWLMNEARYEPAAEGNWLATSNDPAVASARGGVSPATLQTEFGALNPKPPAAFDARLWEASQAHNDNMIDRGCVFSHDGQFDEVDAAGFVTGSGGQGFSGRASIAYGGSPKNRHAALNVDAGFNPPGHRHAIMSTDGDYTNVGIALTTHLRGCFFPWLFSGAYAYASDSAPDHYNRFLVGTVWSDDNGNDRYDPGEGWPGVRVELDPGEFFAVTSAGGGFAVPATAAGATTARFTGGGVATTSSPVTFGGDSVRLDLVVTAPETSSAVPCLAALLLLAGLARRRQPVAPR